MLDLSKHFEFFTAEKKWENHVHIQNRRRGSPNRNHHEIVHHREHIRSIQNRVEIVPQKKNHQNIVIVPIAHRNLQRIDINHRQNIKINVVTNVNLVLHRITGTGVVGDHLQALRPIHRVKVAVQAEIHPIRVHRRLGNYIKINHHRPTQIKFVRCEHQHHPRLNTQRI